jgi:hypothetical protein
VQLRQIDKSALIILNLTPSAYSRVFGPFHSHVRGGKSQASTSRRQAPPNNKNNQVY